jgi:uncharacterized protein YoxC
MKPKSYWHQTSAQQSGLITNMSTPDLPPSPEAPPQPTTSPSRFDTGELLFRMSFLAVIAVSCFVIWWSLTKVLAPRQKESKELATTVARLSSEVDMIDRKWTKDTIEQLDRKFERIPNHTFADGQEVESWLIELKQQLAALGMDVQAEFGKVVPATTNAADPKLVVIPATLTVDVRPVSGPPGSPSAYRRFLQLNQRLATQEKRADIADLTVSGGTNSINHAVFVLNLWAKGGEAR